MTRRVPKFGRAILELLRTVENDTIAMQHLVKMRLEMLFSRPRTINMSLVIGVCEQFLLDNRELTHGDEIWSSDITYVPMRLWFQYLTTVINWHTEYIGSWLLFNTLDERFCLGSLSRA